jgi:acetoin utilization deacetylase AcuC-like enzyme
MSGLLAVYHEGYEVDIGPHVFPTVKYRMVRERLLADGTLDSSSLRRAAPASDAQIGRVHAGPWVRKLKRGGLSRREEQLLEVPYSKALQQAAWLCAGGTTLTARLALEHEVALHLGGGFHHAFADHGEGFCPINDVAVAIASLREAGKIERALVVDCDVHQGNGTAAIFGGEPAVFTFSMHQERNYPAWKPPSDLDLALDDRIGDAEYLELLRGHLGGVVDAFRPDLAFYLAGADPYRDDQLGGLALTIEGLRERDERVLETLSAAHVPAAVVLAGGYARQTGDTITIHCNTARASKMHAR